MDYVINRWRYAARTFAAQFRIYDVDSVIAAGFRAQQIKAILRLTPLTMMANAFNASVLLVIYRHTEYFHAVLLWASALAIIIFLGSSAWLKQRRKPPPSQVSKRALKRATLHALLLAIIWGTLPILTFSADANPANTLLLTTICTGMICAGGFALSTIPQAAISYVCVMTLAVK